MLKLDGVAKTYSSNKLAVRAVDGVTLAIEAKEAVAIQGPSGCGKTTLLLMCGALLRPTGGIVRVAGVDP